MTVAELLEELHTVRARLDAELKGLSDAQFLAPGASGTWSIKDVLAHLTACEAELVTGLSKVRRGQSPGQVFYTDAEIQAQNETWHAETHGQPLDRVLADFRDIRQQLVGQLETLNDQELNAPRPWYTNRTIADWVRSEIVEHDQGHAAHLAEWRRQQGL